MSGSPTEPETPGQEGGFQGLSTEPASIEAPAAVTPAEAPPEAGNENVRAEPEGTIPIDKATLIKLLVAVLLPLAPLLLTMFSLKDLLVRVVEIMF